MFGSWTGSEPDYRKWVKFLINLTCAGFHWCFGTACYGTNNDCVDGLQFTIYYNVVVTQIKHDIRYKRWLISTLGDRNEHFNDHFWFWIGDEVHLKLHELLAVWMWDNLDNLLDNLHMIIHIENFKTRFETFLNIIVKERMEYLLEIRCRLTKSSLNHLNIIICTFFSHYWWFAYIT